MTVRHTTGLRWTPDLIIEAIRHYTDSHGAPPTAKLWKTAGDWPSQNTVLRHFGTWGHAMRTAGVSRGTQGSFRLNEFGRRPFHEARFIMRWDQGAAKRDLSDLEMAWQYALLDPDLRGIVIGQMRDRYVRTLPQIVRGCPSIPPTELRFETPVEPPFETWLIPVMDYKRQIDAWAESAA